VPQAREKFLALRKSTRMDVAAGIEEVYPTLLLSLTYSTVPSGAYIDQIIFYG
jgi:hypothetical protein